MNFPGRWTKSVGSISGNGQRPRADELVELLAVSGAPGAADQARPGRRVQATIESARVRDKRRSAALRIA